MFDRNIAHVGDPVSRRHELSVRDSLGCIWLSGGGRPHTPCCLIPIALATYVYNRTSLMIVHTTPLQPRSNDDGLSEPTEGCAGEPFLSQVFSADLTTGRSDPCYAAGKAIRHPPRTDSSIEKVSPTLPGDQGSQADGRKCQDISSSLHALKRSSAGLASGEAAESVSTTAQAQSSGSAPTLAPESAGLQPAS